jgi:hypothetical protein
MLKSVTDTDDLGTFHANTRVSEHKSNFTYHACNFILPGLANSVTIKGKSRINSARRLHHLALPTHGSTVDHGVLYFSCFWYFSNVKYTKCYYNFI